MPACAPRQEEEAAAGPAADGDGEGACGGRSESYYDSSREARGSRGDLGDRGDVRAGKAGTSRDSRSGPRA